MSHPAEGLPARQDRYWIARPGAGRRSLSRRRKAVRGVLVGLLVLATWLLVRELGWRAPHRVDDRAGVLEPAEIPHFETYLERVHDESGVDIHLVFVDSVSGGMLEDFAVQQARALGIGRDLDRRGVLFAYEVTHRRLRIEVGPTLQSVFTDRFIGYLMRDHVRSFFAAGNPSLGLRLTLFMLHARLRRAALGEEYDPRAADYIEDRRRLATGGGASAAMPDTGEGGGFLDRVATAGARQRFVPQPTVEETYRLYLEWLRDGRFQADVGLFTDPSRTYLAAWPATPAFSDYLLFLEYGYEHRILVRGDLALMYFTDDPLLCPHFFRRTAQGWQIDIMAEVRNTRNYAGGAWTWGLLEQDDDFTRTFIDRYTAIGSILRVAGGDDRPLPIHIADFPRWFSQPGAGDAPGVERLTVTEAAERIAAIQGRPVVVLLYPTSDKKTQRLFPAIVRFVRWCQSRGVEVLAFSVDEDLETVKELSSFLAAHDSPFPAIHLYRWPKGQLTRVMAPLGIKIESSWLPPLVALRDRDGRVVAQVDGIVSRGPDLEVGEIEAAVRQLGEQAAPAAPPP